MFHLMFMITNHILKEFLLGTEYISNVKWIYSSAKINRLSCFNY